ncbi:integrase core domain-containing protein [Leisingera sp. XS_AS12]|uniref:integrase core domain-containing protein n=1 Tax=Leisingera sp. XS_AS12 TaxID=3241294 RepID=UPI003518F3EE
MDGPALPVRHADLDGWERPFPRQHFHRQEWRSLKYECVYLHACEIGSGTKAAIRKWMIFYNHQRPHSALGGKASVLAYCQRQ